MHAMVQPAQSARDTAAAAAAAVMCEAAATVYLARS